MTSALYIVSTLLVVFTLLPLWRNPHWLVRGWDFPRMQLAVLAVALLPVQWVVFDLSQWPGMLVCAATGASLLWQARWIAPYTPLWRCEVAACNDVDADRRIRILTVNVLTSNRNAPALLEQVAELQPDVLVTLESDQWWQDQLDALEPSMPHTIKCPLDNLYGLHVYSRLPLSDAKISFLVEDDKPSAHALVTLGDGTGVCLHCAHPAPPSPTENPESLERDAELIVLARSVENRDNPVIVTGDLNDVAWSSTTRLFRKISGLVDPRVGRGLFNTFPVAAPLLRVPLDHVFHSTDFTLVSIRRLPSIGSDHFPLFVDLVLAPAARSVNNGLDADAEDRARARHIAHRKGASPTDVPTPGG